jgi:hypothetical protein
VAKRDEDLFESLRRRGVRKKTADDLARATDGATENARRALADLTSVVEDIGDRLRGGPDTRSAAARKAAATRKQKARKREAAAEKGARTQATR